MRQRYDERTKRPNKTPNKNAGANVSPDTTTQNWGYSVFWQSKCPEKWPFRWILRTLRHKIGATACSGSPSVRGNGHSAGFPGRYDTKTGLQRVLAVQASGEMACTAVLKWFAPLFLLLCFFVGGEPFLIALPGAFPAVVAP